MKILLSSAFLFFVSTGYAANDFSTSLNSIAGMMNSEKLKAADIEMLDQAFRYPDDKNVFDKIKKNKRVFKNTGWNVRREYHSLVFTSPAAVITRVDFKSGSNNIVINNKEIIISSKKSIRSQIKLGLKFQNEGAAFSLWKVFLPSANARDRYGDLAIDIPLESDEIDAAVTAYAASQKSLIFADYKDQESLMDKNLKYSILANQLRCDPSGKVTGVYDLILNGTKKTTSFEGTIHKSSLKPGNAFQFTLEHTIDGKKIKDEGFCPQPRAYRDIWLYDLSNDLVDGKIEEAKLLDRLQRASGENNQQMVMDELKQYIERKRKSLEARKKIGQRVGVEKQQEIESLSRYQKARINERLLSYCKQAPTTEFRKLSKLEPCLQYLREKLFSNMQCYRERFQENELERSVNPKIAANLAEQAALKATIEAEMKKVNLQKDDWIAGDHCSETLHNDRSRKLSELCGQYHTVSMNVKQEEWLAEYAIRDAQESIYAAVACCNDSACKDEFFRNGSAIKKGTSSGNQ